MRPRKYKYKTSIKTKIFLYFGSIVFCLIVFASTAYYFTAYNTFVKNYTTNSLQLSKIISGQIDQYIEQVNSIQKKILESDSVYDYIFEHSMEKDPRYDWTFRKNLYMITGYDMIFYHMNILNLEDNTLIPFGALYNPFPYKISEQTKKYLIEPAVSRRGARYITPPSYGTLYEVDPDIKTFSLIRSFPRYSDSLSDPKGLIEIQMSVDTIEHFVQEILLSYDNKAEHVYIFDENKELIYPFSLSEELHYFYIERGLEKDNLHYNPIIKEKEIITAYSSESTGFTTIVVTPDSALLSNRNFFRNICLLIAAVSLLLLTTIIYRLARSISLPIIKLKDNISELKLHTISDKSAYMAESNYNELEMLSNAYNHMQLRLKQSLEDIVHAKTLSIHSQIMALQAEMDSHFLYNTLSIIAIVAEENNDLQASDMCHKLTRMLRYITEDYSSSTSFHKELEHARNYTDLMKIRFGDYITFQYDTAPELHSLIVPRLIIQPLIENCVKYSRDDSPNLFISVTSYVKEGYWYSRITDNGSGFTEESLGNIRNKIETINITAGFPHLSIDGMGLVNIYLRLKLFYENDFVFEIEAPAKGASVLIGGKMIYEKE